MMFSFSACMPRMFGGVVKVGGGVGGTSPVTLTNASIPAHNSFNAVTGEILKTSILLGEERIFDPLLSAVIERPLSAEGLGRGGRM